MKIHPPKHATTHLPNGPIVANRSVAVMVAASSSAARTYGADIIGDYLNMVATGPM